MSVHVVAALAKLKTFRAFYNASACAFHFERSEQQAEQRQPRFYCASLVGEQIVLRHSSGVTESLPLTSLDSAADAPALSASKGFVVSRQDGVAAFCFCAGAANPVLAVARKTGLLSLFALEDAARLRHSISMPLNRAAIKFLTGHPTQPVFAVTTSLNAIWCYSETGKLLVRFAGFLEFADSVTVVKFHNSAPVLFVGSNAGLLYLFDLRYKTCVHICRAARGVITDVDYVNVELKGRTVILTVAAASDGSLSLTSTEAAQALVEKRCSLASFSFAGNCEPCFGGEENAAARAQAERVTFAIASEKCTPADPLLRADLRCEVECFVLLPQPRVAAHLAAASTGTGADAALSASFYPLVCERNGAYAVYDLTTAQKVCTLERLHSGFSVPVSAAVRFVPNPARDCFLTLGASNQVTFWNCAAGISPLHALSDIEPDIACVAADASDARRTVMYRNGSPGFLTRYTVDWHNNQVFKDEMQLGFAEELVSIALSSNNRMIALAGSEGSVNVLSLPELNPLLRLRSALTGPLHSVMCHAPAHSESFAGAFVVTLDRKNVLRKWVIDKKCVDKTASDFVATVSRKDAYCAALNAQGTLLTVGCADKRLHLFDAARLKLLYAEKVHDAPVSAVAFSSNGRQVFSASVASAVAAHSIAFAGEKVEVNCVAKVSGVDAPLDCLLAYDENRRLLCGARNGALFAVDLQRRSIDAVFNGHAAAVALLLQVELAAATCYCSLASDGSIILWRDVSEQAAEEKARESAQRREELANIEVELQQRNVARALQLCLQHRVLEKLPLALARAAELIGELDTSAAPELAGAEQCALLRGLLPALLDFAAEHGLLEGYVLSCLYLSRVRRTANEALAFADALVHSRHFAACKKISGFYEFMQFYQQHMRRKAQRFDALLERTHLLRTVLGDA